jgi:hypothetical protein
MLAYSAYYTAYGGPAEVLGFLWARTWPFLTMTGAILAVRLVRKQLWRPDTLIFLMCALVLTAFQFVMLMNGSSAGYVRYMCYPLLICCAWLPYELAPRDPAEGERALSGPGARRFYAAALIALGVWFGWAFQNDEIIREDTLFLLPEGSTQMADYINARLPDSRILMDAYRAYYVFMNLDNPGNVVISSSVDFYESLADPAAHKVEYIMVPESGSYGDMDAVNISYRSLYYGGAPWCEEVTSIGEFKLFRVTESVRMAVIEGSCHA